MVEQLGIYDQLKPMPAMSLGAGVTTLLKITTGYSMLANGGKKIVPTLIDRVQDRYGRTVFRHDKRECTGCNARIWTDQPEPEFLDYREEVMNRLHRLSDHLDARRGGPARHRPGPEGGRQAGGRQDRHHQ